MALTGYDLCNSNKRSYMSNLAKLTLTATSPRQPMTALVRKRIKLLQKLDQQILAAEAEAAGSQYTEEIKRWVKNETTGEKELSTIYRQVKKWWWQNEHGAWMITLRDGNKIIPLDKDKTSVEVGSMENMVQALETLRLAVIVAVIAQELDTSLEKLIAERKLPNKKKSKAA